MKTDIRSVAWLTTRRPTLKLHSLGAPAVRVPMLDGMHVSLLRNWLSSEGTDFFETEDF
jgi:hypothetical protein